MTSRSSHRNFPRPLPRRTGRRSTLWLAASALVAGTVLTACGGTAGISSSASSSTDSAVPPTQPDPPPVSEPTVATDLAPLPSRWDAVLDGITDDGDVSAELAVDAFSLGVAPLPGSQLRRSETDGVVPDASSAVAWVIRHFDELSTEQQDAVGRALSPHDEAAGLGASSGVRRANPSQLGCYGQVVATADSPGAESYRAALDDVTSQISTRLGGSIQLLAPTYLLLDQSDLGVGLAYTWADPGDCENNGIATCTIHLSPDAQDEGTQALRSIMAHEVFHCFQFQYLGMGANDLPPWILEGLPAWVGEDIAGGSSISTKWWGRYLTAPEQSLYGRDYDAIGFYAHLAEVGIEPWSHITKIFDGFSNEPAFEAAGASSGEFLESWPSSTVRRTEFGSAWDAVGPGITIDRATPTPGTVVSGGAVAGHVGKVSGRLFDLSLTADLVTVEFDGWVRLAADDDTDAVLTSGTTYCARAGGCVCPGDTGPDPFGAIAAHVVIAVTGGTSPADIAITGSALDCTDASITVTSPGDWLDPCIVGQWVSTSSFISDQVTGAPVTELGGGAGIVLVVAADGSFTMDFGASTATSTDLGDGLIISSQTRGTAHGHMTAANGLLTLVDADYTSTLTTHLTGGGSIAGGTGIGSGTYTCWAGHVEFRTHFDLGETINAFSAA